MTNVKYISESEQDKILKKVLNVAKILGVTERKDTIVIMNKDYGYQANRRLSIQSKKENKKKYDYQSSKSQSISFEFVTNCIGLEKKNKLKILSNMVSPAGCSVSLNVSAARLEKESIQSFADELFTEYKKQWAKHLKDRQEYLDKKKTQKLFKESLGYIEGHQVPTGKKTTKYVPSSLYGRETDIGIDDETGILDIHIHNLDKFKIINLCKFLKTL